MSSPWLLKNFCHIFIIVCTFSLLSWQLFSLIFYSFYHFSTSNKSKARIFVVSLSGNFSFFCVFSLPFYKCVAKWCCKCCCCWFSCIIYGCLLFLLKRALKCLCCCLCVNFWCFFVSFYEFLFGKHELLEILWCAELLKLFCESLVIIWRFKLEK